MGQTLSEPVTDKETSFCQNSMFKVGSSCMQGWRVNMEDAHTHILSLPDDPDSAFFAVYDGHGGSAIANYAGKNLHKFITNRPEFKEGNIEEALKQTFLEIDEVMLTDEFLKNEQSGSTAICVLIKDNKVYCANVGDSRAVASVAGRVDPLSYDHKPTNQEEFERIMAAGGWVDCNRVNGNLALSRALGDYIFKKNKKKTAKEQMVTAYPDVEIRTITPDWEFIVIACDGIWDVMTNEEVVAFIRSNMAEGLDPEEICEALMMNCLAPDCQMAGLGCDNMTVVIIAFLHGGTYEDLCAKCKSTVPENSISTEVEQQVIEPECETPIMQ